MGSKLMSKVTGMCRYFHETKFNLFRIKVSCGM